MTAGPRPADLLYAVDENYVVPLSVSLRSMQQHTDPDAVRVTILCDDVSAESRRRIRASVPCPASVELVDIDGGRLPDLARSGVSTRYSRAALAPLAIDRELVHPERFLYLDADTVVRADVTRLLATDLEARALGAVYDHGYTRFAQRTGRLAAADRGPARCFNSGVLVVDTRRWFGGRLGQRALEIAVARDILDQGALNLVCCDDWTELDAGWNVTTQQLLLSGRFRSASEEVLIRHLTAVKPWLTDSGRRDDARLQLADFHAHLARTAWGELSEVRR